MRHIGTSRRTARRERQCQSCGTIAAAPGQEYQRDAYTADGRIWTWVQCDACWLIVNRVAAHCQDADDGVGPEEFSDWAHCLAGTDPDADAYLSRSPWERTP